MHSCCFIPSPNGKTYDIAYCVHKKYWRNGMTKNLILNGSPRINGDTVGLIGKMTGRIGGEYKIVDAYRCSVSPCLDCR